MIKANAGVAIDQSLDDLTALYGVNTSGSPATRLLSRKMSFGNSGPLVPLPAGRTCRKPDLPGTANSPVYQECERITRMRIVHPISLEVLLLICSFALLIDWGRWRGMTRNQPPLSKKARWLAFAALMTVL